MLPALFSIECPIGAKAQNREGIKSLISRYLVLHERIPEILLPVVSKGCKHASGLLAAGTSCYRASCAEKAQQNCCALVQAHVCHCKYTHALGRG